MKNTPNCKNCKTVFENNELVMVTNRIFVECHKCYMITMFEFKIGDVTNIHQELCIKE